MCTFEDFYYLCVLLKAFPIICIFKDFSSHVYFYRLSQLYVLLKLFVQILGIFPKWQLPKYEAERCS